MNIAETRKVISDHLEKLGWVPWRSAGSSVVAYLEVRTMVGVREAVVLLRPSPANPLEFVLVGDFVGRGENVLQDVVEKIDTAMDDDQVVTVTERFANRVNNCISRAWSIKVRNI